MKTFNAHVNSYYAPKFEAETLADAIDFANANFLNNVGAPKKIHCPDDWRGGKRPLGSSIYDPDGGGGAMKPSAPTMKTIGTPVHDLSLDFNALDAVGAGWACSSSVPKKEMIRARALIARLDS